MSDTHEHKLAQQCSFCDHRSIAEVDSSDLTICYHCVKLVSANIEPVRKFLNCW